MTDAPARAMTVSALKGENEAKKRARHVHVGRSALPGWVVSEVGDKPRCEMGCNHELSAQHLLLHGTARRSGGVCRAVSARSGQGVC